MALDRDQCDGMEPAKAGLWGLLLDGAHLMQWQEQWPQVQAMEGRAGGGREGPNDVRWESGRRGS